MVRSKLSKKEAVFAVSGILLALSVLTFYIWQQAEAVRLGLNIGNLEKTVATLTEETKKLEIKKSSLLSLNRVEKIAKEELGLTEAKDNQVFFEEVKRIP
jgi:cell division protein FtsL